MKRFYLVALCAVVCVTPSRGQTPEAIKGTIAYVQSLQTREGGFVTAQPKPTDAVAPRPTLRSTSAAVRALKYLGGEIRDRESCARFVASCFDKKSGGFTDLPGGKPDVFTTAVGLMAVAELKMPATYHNPAVKYLAENAKTFDDIRIAVAGLERIKQESPRAKAWLEQVRKELSPDGTSGKEAGVARATASVSVTMLRLGDKVPKREQIFEALNKGQQRNGAWGKDGGSADLETTYRVMRAYVMLGGRPRDAQGVRSYVAKCRNEDGGYGVAPGQPSSVGATYFASIILHWLDRK
ncbi:MAG: terpene cyclase/mutase family protein [Gemmataceae bacterium]|nr:terpene cyclase/mutase family protein [Gemmataceae bacterium]